MWPLHYVLPVLFIWDVTPTLRNQFYIFEKWPLHYNQSYTFEKWPLHYLTNLIRLKSDPYTTLPILFVWKVTLHIIYTNSVDNFFSVKGLYKLQGF